MEYINKLHILFLVFFIASCGTKQETKNREQTHVNLPLQDSVIEIIDTLKPLKENDIFTKGECNEFRDENTYTFSEICNYPYANNLEDLYRIFKQEYKFTTPLLSKLPYRDTTIKGDYPDEINYLKTKFNNDTVQINLIFPGGEDYIYLYTKNDSCFINHTYSPD